MGGRDEWAGSIAPRTLDPKLNLGLRNLAPLRARRGAAGAEAGRNRVARVQYIHGPHPILPPSKGKEIGGIRDTAERASAAHLYARPHSPKPA